MGIFHAQNDGRLAIIGKMFWRDSRGNYISSEMDKKLTLYFHI